MNLLEPATEQYKRIVIRPSITPLSTEIYIGKGLLDGVLLEFLSQLQGKRVIVADPVVTDLYAATLAKRVGAELLTIPRGEGAKTQETVTYLMDELFQRGMGRDTTLLAFGGGVTLDLVGFVASIYMRGIPLILIPTTLLGCVDAAIGGKTAIDTPFGKNLVGTIYHPKAIFADLDTLQTLTKKEESNGLAEILKMGLIHDPLIWDLAEQNEKDPALILRAIQGKIAIIEQDPLEQGLRRILNYGHTIGHALETVAQYEMAHGEAVALGCLTESHLSMRLGYLSQADFEQIRAMYSRFSFKLPKTYLRTKLFSAMTRDKKRVSGEMRFVLIDRIGHALPFEGMYVRAVSPSDLEATLDWMERFVYE